MKILAIGTSNSRDSINRELAAYAASLVEKAQIEVLDINDYCQRQLKTDPLWVLICNLKLTHPVS
jgi:chromate reductase, NAD(P)H dehydrogenase (quinone)